MLISLQWINIDNYFVASIKCIIVVNTLNIRRIITHRVSCFVRFIGTYNLNKYIHLPYRWLFLTQSKTCVVCKYRTLSINKMMTYLLNNSMLKNTYSPLSIILSSSAANSISLTVNGLAHTTITETEERSAILPWLKIICFLTLWYQYMKCCH